MIPSAPILSLVLIVSGSAGPAAAQTWGQPAPSASAYVNPRLPLGPVGRAVVAAGRAPLPGWPGQPGQAQVVVVVVVPNIVVLPSQVIIDPPQIHFVPDAPPPPPPSAPATDTVPR